MYPSSEIDPNVYYSDCSYKSFSSIFESLHAFKQKKVRSLFPLILRPLKQK